MASMRRRAEGGRGGWEHQQGRVENVGRGIDLEEGENDQKRKKSVIREELVDSEEGTGMKR